MESSTEVIEVLKAIDLVKKSMKALKKTKISVNGLYKYVTLDDVLELQKKVLPRHKLGFVQLIENKNGSNCLTTIVFHNSGQYISSSAFIPDVKDDFLSTMQSVGSNITYMRRYELCTIFGICSEDDTDGAGSVSGYLQKDKDLIQNKCAERQLKEKNLKKIKDMIKNKINVDVILKAIDGMK